MTRRLAAGAVPLLAAGAALAGAVSSDAPAAAPSRLLVSGREYAITLSRPSVRHGRVVIQLLNRGEDDHDLRLRRISRSASAPPTARWPVTRPGRVAELELRLRPGRYRLWCAVAGHRALGMRATLRVSGGR